MPIKHSLLCAFWQLIARLQRICLATNLRTQTATFDSLATLGVIIKKIKQYDRISRK